MEQGRFTGYILLFLFAASIWVLWPLLDALLFGVFVAYLLVYLKQLLDQYMESRLSGAAIITGLIILVGGLVTGFASSLTSIGANLQAFLNTLSGSASFLTRVFDFPDSVATMVGTVVEQIGLGIRSTLLQKLQGFPSAMLDFFVFVVTVIYFFWNGEQIENTVFNSIDVMEGREASMARTVLRSLYDLFNGVFLVRAFMAISMLFVSGLGFYFLGVEFWWGWAMLVAVFEFLPLVGPAFIYIPVGLLHIALGAFWQGVLVILFGIVFIDTLPELYLRPRLMIPRADEHPLLLFFGFFAGPILLGVKGVFIGPAVLVLTRDLVTSLYNEATLSPA